MQERLAVEADSSGFLRIKPDEDRNLRQLKPQVNAGAFEQDLIEKKMAEGTGLEPA